MIVATGYYEHPAAQTDFRIWLENTLRFAERNTPANRLERIYVINAGAPEPDLHPAFHAPGVQWVNLLKNPGHPRLENQTGRLNGWTQSFLLGCMLTHAAGEGEDMIYKESDCLAFGNWVDRLYREIGSAGMITGKVNTGGEANGLLGQSLVLVKNWYLLDFVQRYLADTRSDGYPTPEHKFEDIGKATGLHVMTSMGYDRSRPANFVDAEFYIQKYTDAELTELRTRGLI